jgi:hypothetical protein
MPSNPEVAHIGFRTDRIWTAEDVATLASSASGIYDVLSRMPDELRSVHAKENV